MLIATLAAAGAAAGVALPGHTEPPKPDCIVFDEAGVLGGGTWRLCGEPAFERCAAGEQKLAAQCAELERKRD